MQWSPNKQGKFRNSLGDEAKRPTPQERNTFSTDIVPEKAILVAVCPSGQTMERTEEYLAELAFLLETAGGICVKKVIQKLERPDTRTYLGSGKLEELKEYKQALDADFIVVDDELSPAQLRNLEKEMQCRILDRTTLILDIFAKRARTSTARTQVELAQLQYMLPRLTRMWTHLERQRGGIGMRGPGETQIETDRRLIKEKISLLRQQLASIDKQKTLQRKNRESLVRVALVGYTNVGKSTLMNLLSKSDVFAENKLFATLDTTVRKVVIGNLPFLLTDTVGFIRKLPTQLVESFKSTLDEVVEADLLLHVVDLSHPDHMKLSVPMTLTLGLSGQPFNGPDIGGFCENSNGELVAQWTALGVYFPFVRNHNTKGTIAQEPWAFTPEVLDACRTAINRRYRLMPYIYTLFREASETGMPVMRPLFMADPTDLSLRSEDRAFLLGGDLLVRPQWAGRTAMPKTAWQPLALEAATDSFQCELRQRPGSVIPLANLAQSTTDLRTDSLTLLVCIDGEGKAVGQLYEDEGDGFSYREGCYRQTSIEATLRKKQLTVRMRQVGGKMPALSRMVRIGFVAGGRVRYSAWQQGNEFFFNIK